MFWQKFVGIEVEFTGKTKVHYLKKSGIVTKIIGANGDHFCNQNIQMQRI